MCRLPSSGSTSCNCKMCSNFLGYRGVMPGQKGWRSPQPQWWVDEARRQLKIQNKSIDDVAAVLQMDPTMVTRALHRDPDRRVATLETLDAISDELRMPRPIVVATSLDLALKLQRLTLSNAVDGAIKSTKGEILRDAPLREESLSRSDGVDGRKTTAGSVVASRDRVAAVRPGSIRRNPRAR